jgi:hypothetical protein
LALPPLLASLPWLLLLPVLTLPAFPWLAGLAGVATADAVSLDGGVDVVDDVVDGLPQSLWAAAETASPWPGPGGVSWATPETNSPWLVTSAGHGIVAGLVAAAVLLVDDASLELVVGAAVDDVDDDVDDEVDGVVEEDDVADDVDVGGADVVVDAAVVVVEDGFGGAKGVSAGVPDGP